MKKLARLLTENRLSAFDAVGIVIVATLADKTDSVLLACGVVLFGALLVSFVGNVLKYIAK